MYVNSCFCLISRVTDQFYLILVSISHTIFFSNDTTRMMLPSLNLPPSQALYVSHVLSEQKSHYLHTNYFCFKQSCKNTSYIYLFSYPLHICTHSGTLRFERGSETSIIKVLLQGRVLKLFISLQYFHYLVKPKEFFTRKR